MLSAKLRLQPLRDVVNSGSRTISKAPPPMPPCEFKPEKYKGPTQSQLAALRKSNVNPGLFLYYKTPVALHQGHKQWLFDLEGNRYLDLIAGIATVIAGHCHPKINEAATKQMTKLWHSSNIYMHPNLHEYAAKLAAKLPDPLKVVYLVNSGSEANDLAVLMSRLYTGCMDILTLRNCYHGASPITMGLTAQSTWYYNYPASMSIQKIRNPDPYKGPWGGSKCRDSPIQADRECSCKPGQCKACDMYVEEVEDVMKFCTPKEKVGGIFVESIQGVGGTVQFPKGWVKKAFEIVRSKGGVCISDEVQTGFGRTGDHYWGFQGHGVVPDMVVMAKGIGNGYPLAAVVTTPEIASVMSKAIHFNTFGGNPVACAVGMATLDVIDEDGLQKNALDVGTYFLKELAKLRDEFAIVGDVRGKGLMIGVELVDSKDTRKPLPAEETANIMEHLKEMRILMGKGGNAGQVLRIKPPMCITKADADYTVACLRIALNTNREKYPRK